MAFTKTTHQADLPEQNVYNSPLRYRQNVYKLGFAGVNVAFTKTTHAVAAGATLLRTGDALELTESIFASSCFRPRRSE